MIHSRWSSGDLIFYDGTQDIMTIKDDTDGIIFGEDDEGVDVVFFGDTTGCYLEFDESADLLNFKNIKITYQDPNTETSTGATITLTSASNRIQFLTSTGAFNVLLPPSSGSNAGIEFKIFNSTGGTCGVYNGSSGNGALATLNLYEGAIFFSDGSNWRSILGSTA